MELFSDQDIEALSTQVKPLVESSFSSESEEEFFPRLKGKVKAQVKKTEEQTLQHFLKCKLTSSGSTNIPQKRQRSTSKERQTTAEEAPPTKSTQSEQQSSKKFKPAKSPEQTEEVLWDLGPEESEGVYSNTTPHQLQMMRLAKEIDEKNKPITDIELNSMLPWEGFEIVPPPPSYKPASQNPTSVWATQLQFMSDHIAESYVVPGSSEEDMPVIKPEDLGYFGSLLTAVDFDNLPFEEQKERRTLELLLKVKNGEGFVRKTGLRQLTNHAQELGAAVIFKHLIPLLMAPTLEPQERHMLVKALDRVIYRLGKEVQWYVHKVLVVTAPMLVDADFYTRMEGREVVGVLARAVGLPSILQATRSEIDHHDELVRNTTARAIAVAASALGTPSVLGFVQAVVISERSWMARWTGWKIVQHLATLQGWGVLPHLKSLVALVCQGLTDEIQKVRIASGLAIAALAEASIPFGIDSFDPVLQVLQDGIRRHRGRTMAAFLKAIGFIIPLMEQPQAAAYMRGLMPIVTRQFKSTDVQVRDTTLKVVRQWVAILGIEVGYVKREILPKFMEHYWKKVAGDSKQFRSVIMTTVDIAGKIGGNAIWGALVVGLKDEHEGLRRMVLEAICRVLTTHGVQDIPKRLEMLIMDGILYVYQQQQVEETKKVVSFVANTVSAFGFRAKPHINSFVATIQYRMNNSIPRVRQEAALLISAIAETVAQCEEHALLGRLGVVLYEALGEEYPEVLGSILLALNSIVKVIGMANMNPPIADLLPKCTPILRNANETVQENVVDLVGQIADRGAEFVSAKEWMRICIDLIELLGANRKAIRRNSANAFGYIAKTIGPQDVLATLLSNLRQPERQIRVWTTIAMAIVSDTCGPFTTVPILMNEYRIPEKNVQNGVLKALAFMFEYIGESSKDYIYVVLPLLEDALIDQDLVHRQLACSAVKHLALGVAGMGWEDALVHLLNLIWPNIFETTPHVGNTVIDALEGLRVGLGSGYILPYLMQGLFHPARKVRTIYWRIYNQLVLGNQDQLVAFYPSLPGLDRSELDIIIQMALQVGYYSELPSFKEQMILRESSFPKRYVTQLEPSYIKVDITQNTTISVVKEASEQRVVLTSTFSELTINALVKLMTEFDNLDSIADSILEGDYANVDMRIRDVYGDSDHSLPIDQDLIACAMGKIEPHATGIDIARSLVQTLAINVT